jgi:parallel beta-helix repeat protein
LRASEKNLVANNTFKGCNDGLRLEYEKYTEVSNNIACQNIVGMSLQNSEHNNITNNNLLTNQVGILLCNLDVENSLLSNNISKNDIGIKITDSPSYNNKIFFNYITYNNNEGIYADFNPNYNRISNNYFICNNKGGFQAYDGSRKNFWNMTAEGNYWSDWAFPDHNHDGIVDFPYNLDGGTGAKDYFPIADANPPDIEIFSPKNGDTVNGDITIDIKASDDYFLKFVNLSINGTTVAIHADAFNYLWHTTTIINSWVNLSAEATDASNNHVWFNITVRVSNNHAPGCSITSPVTGDIVSGNIIITGTASDLDGNSTLFRVYVVIDVAGWILATGTTSWSLSWNTTSVVDGPHTICALSTDINSTDSNPVTVDVTTKNSKIIKWGWLAGVISSDNSSAINATVTVNQTGGTTFSGSDGQYNLSVLEGDPYDVRVDAANHLTAYASGILISDQNTTNKDFMLQYNGPNIIRCIISNPSDGDIVNGTIVISGTSTYRTSAISLVQVRVGTGSWDNATGTQSWSFSWNTRIVANGNYKITARASDGTTYSPQASVTITVSNGVWDKGNITVIVRDRITNEGIVSANVIIPSLGLTKTTDNSGYSNITGILPGKYDVIVSKKGYENSTKTVTVNKTETARVDFRLVPVSSVETQVMGKVVKNSTSTPISNATIRIGNYTTKSGHDGKYLLKLPAGNYTLNVTKDGYKPYQREIHIVTGNNTINVSLDPVESKSSPGSNIYIMATIVLIAVVSVSLVWFAASFIRKKKKPAEISRFKKKEETKEDNDE